ncbi:MAG: response regulator [Erythrobacter sp.]
MAHILIADDDDLIAELLGDALAAAGHPSHQVPSAEAAWECVHARRPDLLLLDQDMPGMSGLALLAKLRASPLFYDLPVVMLTAMRPGTEGGIDKHEAMRAGAQDLARKPFEPAALVARIEAALTCGVVPGSQALGQEKSCGEDMSEGALPWQRHLPRARCG